jgi:hypothetical protein
MVPQRYPPGTLTAQEVRHMIHWSVNGLAPVALTLLVSALLSPIDRPPEQEVNWQQTFPAGGLGIINLNVLNGSIAVEAWDRPEISARAILHTDPPSSSDARRQIDSIRIDFRPDGSALRGEVQGPRPAVDNVSTDFTLRVPRDLALDLRTASGAISVTDVAAPISLLSSNGSIAVSNAPGPLTLETSNGSVTVALPAGAGAQLDLLTANGEVSVPGVTGASRTQLTSPLGGGGPTLRVRTGNGSIVVTQGP